MNVDILRHTIHQVIEVNIKPITGVDIIYGCSKKLGLTISQINKDHIELYSLLQSMIEYGELVITPMNGVNYYSLGKMN